MSESAVNEHTGKDTCTQQATWYMEKRALTMLVSLNTNARGRGLVMIIFLAAAAFCRSRSIPFAETNTKSALILRRLTQQFCSRVQHASVRLVET